MKAVILNGFGDASVLQISEVEKPTVSDTEVLLKVAAAGLNRADIAQRNGRYPAPAGTVANILGLEVSGTVVETGAKVKNLKIGDTVSALLAGGGYAEYVSVAASNCMPVPKGIDLIDAAAIPEVLCTVWMNLFQTGNLQPGQTALIYGGSGGIGSMGIQLVRLFGAQAFTLAGNDEKVAFCKSLGAEKVVLYTKEDLVEVLGENSVDVILEMIGGAYLNKNLDVLKEEGKMVYINTSVRNSELNIFRMMQKRITLTGSTLRARSVDFKAKLIEDVVANAYPLLEHPEFKNMVNHRFHYSEVVKAHELLESGDFCGKIVLVFGKEDGSIGQRAKR